MDYENNCIEVCGLVVSDYEHSHQLHMENFYRFNVEVDRLSGTSDILPVTASERVIARELMRAGIFVRISGQIRTYNNYVEEERRNKLVQTLFARDIELLDVQPDEITNEVYLTGYLCKPAVYRTTPFGREIADLLLAVNRTYGKSDYIPCIAWGRNARFAGRLSVGDKIHIQGRMQSRIYEKKLPTEEVVEKTAYEVSISSLALVEE